jgi:branched-chain amino acid transport system permease protein
MPPLQIIISALTNGAIYGLIALGFVLIYKGTGVVNFGYGDQVTTGAYFALIPMTFFGMRYGAATVFALLASIVLGAIIYYVLMWPLRNQSLLARIIATLAFGTVLREFFRAFMGPDAWPFPFLLSPNPVSIGGLLVVPANLAIVGAALLVLTLLYLFLERTFIGKAILATCDNRLGAGLIGVPVSKVFLLIWILASVLATIAGTLVAPVLTLSPDMGLIGIKGFTAAVLGGFTSLPGAVLGGIVLGLLEAISGVYVSSALKDAVRYGVLFIMLLSRPQGLLGPLLIKKV